MNCTVIPPRTGPVGPVRAACSGNTVVKLRLIAAIALTSAPAVSHAEEIENFIFDFRSDMVCATGVISGLMGQDGWVSIYAGELTVQNGAYAGSYDLIANPNGSSYAISPLGYFIYDNRVAPSAQTSMNVYGLLFGAGGLEINIWGNGDNNPYTFYARDGSTIFSRGGDFVLSSVPAPAGLALACIGVALSLRRRFR